MLEKVEELKPDIEARGIPEVNVGWVLIRDDECRGHGFNLRRSYTVLG